MLEVLAAFSKKDLIVARSNHPLIGRFFMHSMKKFAITFEERYYFYLKDKFHRGFWITERNLIPTFSSDRQHFFFIIQKCPICKAEHVLYEKQYKTLQEDYPDFIEDMKYITKFATKKAEKVYKHSISLGESEDQANEKFTFLYKQLIENYTHDSEWGKILNFPKANDC